MTGIREQRQYESPPTPDGREAGEMNHTVPTRANAMPVDNLRLTQRNVAEYVRRLGGTFRKTEYGDFRLRFEGGFDYFTDSLADVVGTTRVYRESHWAIQDAEAYLLVESGLMEDNAHA